MHGSASLLDGLRHLGESLDRQRLALHALAGSIEAAEAGGTPPLTLRIDSQGRIAGASAQAASLILWDGTPIAAGSLLTVASRDESIACGAFPRLEAGGMFEATVKSTGARVLVVVAEAKGGKGTVLLWPLDAQSLHAASLVPEDVRLITRRAAHDFNNVLSTMVGYAELAMMLSNEPRIAHYLSEIYTSGKRGQGMVNMLQQQLSNAATKGAVDNDVAKGHVLVVDDESSVADLLAEILRAAGYAVSATYSPDEALRLFRRDPGGFDLLITDQTMPEMTGLALAQEINRIRADLPFVLCTGWGDTVQVQHNMQSTARNFVAKPVEADALVNLVEQLISDNAAGRHTNAA